MHEPSCPGPPSAPYDLTLPLVGLSAAHLNWTAPEDDGGVSDPSWDPAIDGKQNSTTLTYTVTLTNGKDTTTVTTKALSLIVSNLHHSTAYTVTVVAENVYERGPEATTVFSTGNFIVPCACKYYYSMSSLTLIALHSIIVETTVISLQFSSYRLAVSCDWPQCSIGYCSPLCQHHFHHHAAIPMCS